MFIKPKTDVFSLKMGHDEKAVKRPLNFKLVWKTGDWEDRDWKGLYTAIWRLNCSKGYVALGHLAQKYVKNISYYHYPNGMRN
jgi:hypothetical protein